MSDAGDSASFEFVSRWEVSADRESVWAALVDFKQWPIWWPGLESVIETIHGDPDGIGQKATAVWRGPVGYTLKMSIEAVERVHPDFLRGVASGDVVGEGTWTLATTDDDWTSIAFDWNVRANRKWMEFLAPVARPLFVSSHDHVMKDGAQGLASHLECDLRGFSASVG
jgi:uncharacterized protein YndB with AHSA1/START domain